MRRPDYILTDVYRLMTPRGVQELPAGTIVQPIYSRYVPKHIVEKYSTYEQEEGVFIGCRYGIALVPKSLLKEVY